MKHTSFLRKYNGYAIRDDIGEKSPEFMTFGRDVKSMLTTEFPDCDVNIRFGHYDISGFISKGNKHVYISYSVPRHEHPMDFSKKDAMFGVLYRTAKSTSDFTGGINHFSAMKTLPENIKKLLLL